jgi:two-component system sensor histidine kinase KdpD
LDLLRGRWSRWITWGAATALVTIGLLAFRGRLDKAHIALFYLLLVLAGTAVAGRVVGLVLAGLTFVLFDWLFLPPYGTLTVADPLDWLVLLAFLIVSGVVAEMLHRLTAEATAARERTAEVDQLAQVGAESLNVARADDALTKVTDIIRETLRIGTCRIHVAAVDQPADRSSDSLVQWVAEHGRAAMRLGDGTTHLTGGPALPADRMDAAHALFLPLQVRGRTVGVLELAADRLLQLPPEHQRYLSALAYYAALGVERSRLEIEARKVEAFREADRLKDALLASVSHDLRTPLTTIKALAHDLRLVDDRAFIIEEEADRLNRLVVNLLDLSRLQGRALPVHLEVNAVDDLLGALAQRVAGLLGARPLPIALEDGGTLLVGRFDFVHALRILANLVENADKYAPPGTPIEVAARRRGAEIEVTVADRGPGIAPGQSDLVFEPFYRAPGLPPDTGGAGLGLAIARQLARVQGGEVRYAPRDGGGSVFTVTLPAADLPAVSAGS